MVIDFQNVDIYKDDQLILKNINLQVEKGDFVFLTGKVGTGKSTLISCIHGETSASTGSAIVLGKDLKKIKRDALQELRRNMGIVFQRFHLLSDRTIYANLEFVLKATGWKKEYIKPRIEDILNKVGLYDKIDKYPYELSGGEQQRIALARAILNSPDIILADEPTGNLDIENSLKIIDILKAIRNSGTTVIMSTHNLNLIQEVENARVIKFENNTITES